jgi:hypothetical protein
MSFDLNIKNYGPEDVLALFKLPDLYCDADVDEKAMAIQTQLLTEDMPPKLKDEISIFLDAARNMIKRDWMKQPPGREDLVSRPPIPNVPAKIEEYVKGDVNPYMKRTMTKVASVDTLFRTNYSNTSSTNFAYTLPESIRNVVSMRLASIEMPNMINMFSSLNKSNTFVLRLYNVTGEADATLTITIPNGSYMTDSMVLTMNNLLQTAGGGAEFIIFEILASSKTVFRNRNVGEGSSPYDTPSSHNSPNFRFEIDFVVEGKLLCSTAGWNLGFRNALYETGSTVVNQENGETYRNYFLSESSYGSGVDNYLFLEVDDFHNNFQTDTVISTNATSYLGKNILARVIINGGAFTIIQNSGNDGIFKKREYLGPVRVEKLHFRLLNKFGEVVDLTHNDFSFSLEFVTIYG